ncbi:MAG: HAMP domain-containing protein [Clostridiales bacterium]|nr:HAMP domain-containing protein [Clostridiales bacterium]
MKRLSIKLRVTLWITALMVLVAAAALALLFVVGREMMAQSLRETLMEAVEENGAALAAIEGELDTGDVDSFDRGVYLMVYDGEGYPIHGRMPLGYADELAFRDGVLQRVDEWYLYDTLFEVDGFGQVWVRGVISGEEAEATVNALFRIALIALPGLVLLAAIGGYLITVRAFRPVRQIAETARQISSGDDLTRRIGLGDGRDEIYTLAAAFDHMFDRLQASFERERQFTSDVAHELRTPVAVIISQCELALESNQTPEEQQEALETVLERARRMSSLIAQLLTMARADQGRLKLNLEELNLSELTQMAVEELTPQAEGKEISIITDIQPNLHLQGDETMLLRMLLNLMENGIRYGREGGHLWVGLARQGEKLVGTVRDDGIGISPEQLPHIWERFYQADPARSGSREGAGLGLPMARYIAQAHGGAVSAESVEGVGSVFTFRLPENPSNIFEKR